MLGSRWNSQDLESWSKENAKGKIIELDTHRTHFIEAGQGPPLILLHGFFFDHHLWDPNIEALSRHFKVFGLDLWGFGASTREPLDPGYPLYARQLLLLLDHLGIEKAHLMGQSMGGGTIIQFAAQHPDRVQSMVLVDPAALPNPLPLFGKIANLPGLGEFLYNFPGNAMRKFSLHQYFVKQRKSIDYQAYRNFVSFHQVKGSTEFMLRVLRKKFFDTLSQEVRQLSQLDLPTLIIWGREEKGIPLKVGRQLEKLLPQSQFEVFDNAGHCPNLDRPETFNEMAIKFLKAH